MTPLAALQLLQGVLTLVQMGSQAAVQISATIEKARAENRDITDDELAQIRAKTDEIEARLLQKLQVASSQPK